MRTIAMLPACSVFVTQPFLVSRITASPEVIAPYSSALPLDWILDPNKGSSSADRVLARLIQAEAHESDPWYRDDCRQAFIVLSLALKGESQPFVSASYRMYGLHPDKLYPAILARREALLGPAGASPTFKEPVGPGNSRKPPQSIPRKQKEKSA